MPKLTKVKIVSAFQVCVNDTIGRLKGMTVLTRKKQTNKQTNQCQSSIKLHCPRRSRSIVLSVQTLGSIKKKNSPKKPDAYLVTEISDGAALSRGLPSAYRE